MRLNIIKPAACINGCIFFLLTTIFVYKEVQIRQIQQQKKIYRSILKPLEV